ncbi:EXS family-domain-containing protein [Plectosphaerella cucumerina]|jgi:hypothetical protein|uniref:EXS family-domain-containing protein n=1 Tax=Plectosphaerella cucumerina TaxID=40658 RepID=A0A8K0TSJ9_9PEZI|nr:EXS family-domain-containing protein [Plectosphaerella cucumerina]
MDFSLLQPSARHRYLRDITALKKRWVYYAIMVADPILRFAWIFYAIFTHDRQHSTVVSFLVSFAEAFRRGIWALLRVENEHCANVAVYKASRDVPLPYRLQPLVENISEEGSRPGSSDEEHPAGEGGDADAATATATSVQRVGTNRTIDEEADAGAQSPSASGTVRRRKTGVIGSFRGIQRSFSKILAEAHRQDFVKKRKPDAATSRLEGSGGAQPQSDDDDEEDEEGDEEEDEALAAAEHGLRKEAEDTSRNQRAGGSSSRG